MNDLHECFELFELFFSTTETAQIYDYEALPLYAKRSLIEKIVSEILYNSAESDYGCIDQRLASAVGGIYRRNKDNYQGTKLETVLKASYAGYLKESKYGVTDLVEIWINALDQIHLYLREEGKTKDELTTLSYTQKIFLYLESIHLKKIRPEQLYAWNSFKVNSFVVEVDNDSLWDYLDAKTCSDNLLYGVVDYLTTEDIKDWFKRHWYCLDDPALLKPIYYK